LVRTLDEIPSTILERDIKCPEMVFISPLTSISTYKVGDLREMCKARNLPTIENGKTMNKPILYETLYRSYL
jgi:hypothetical protein